LRPLPTSTIFPYTTLFRSLFGKEVLFFHFGEIRRVNGEARLSQRLGNTNEVDTVFAGRIDAVNDEDRRIRPLSPIHIDRNAGMRSEEHTSELQSRSELVCR